MKVSFYPGPSTVHKEIPQYINEAYEQGILSVNHRSPAFAEVMEKTLHLLKDRLNIPENYEIVFTSSATECWEIIAQSFIISNSFHFFNGDFGKKWFRYTEKLISGSESFQFDLNDELLPDRVDFPDNAEVMCITQNETSNGTQVGLETIRAIRNLNPDKLIAIDATSSMAGIALDIKQADIWFASVQKCFGLPSGLGLMVCSPAAIKKAYNINENKHYNSMVFMLDNARNLQTHYTPNVLAIFLLMKVLEARENIYEVEKKLKIRNKNVQDIIGAVSVLHNLCINEKVRSSTVICVQSKEEVIADIKLKADKEGIILGNGYGSYKNDSFRIANFPAIPDNDFHLLGTFLKNYTY